MQNVVENVDVANSMNDISFTENVNLVNSISIGNNSSTQTLWVIAWYACEPFASRLTYF